MRQVYQYLKKHLPQQTAHRWAFQRIPSVVKLEGSNKPEGGSSPKKSPNVRNKSPFIDG
jgi:hypothetical protein